MSLVHAPLYFQPTLDGQITVECDCTWRSEPYDSRSGALQAIGEHIANPGGSL